MQGKLWVQRRDFLKKKIFKNKLADKLAQFRKIFPLTSVESHTLPLHINPSCVKVSIPHPPQMRGRDKGCGELEGPCSLLPEVSIHSQE